MVTFDIEEQRVILLALALLLGATAAQIFSKGGPGRPRPDAGKSVASRTARVERADPNEASYGALMNLPGMSTELAASIVKHRAGHILASIADVEALPGVRRQDIARVAPYFSFPGAPSAQPPARKLDLNKATLEELEAVPGIGATTARAIIDRRVRRRFTHLEELLQMTGIGPKKLEKLQLYLTIGKDGGD